MAIEPPYPADLEAKGWSLDLDYERIEQSDTWAIASAEQRPWLLMLWMIAWRQSPVASLPNNDKLIAARIGMPLEQFAAWRDVLMSGWGLATDGRLYHRTLTNHALKMAEKRNKDRARVAAFRAKSQSVDPCNALHTSESPVSSTPPPTPSPEEKQKPSGAEPPEHIVPDGETCDPPADPPPGAPPARQRGCTFATFIAECRAKGEKPIPEDHPVFRFADDAGIPVEFVRLAWFEFRRDFGDGGKSAKKRQAGMRGWRQHFDNAVRKGWYRLWAFDRQGECYLTPAGIALKREAEARDAA